MPTLINKKMKQLTLPAIPEASPTKDNGSAFNDPAFASNKILPIHRWVPWIAGFSSDFVQGALGKYLTTKGVVLDPFSGVGTTLVESVLQGHRAIGFDINPYAALACETKLNAFKVNQKTFQRYIANFQKFYKNKPSPKSSIPEGFKTRAPFYSPTVLNKVLIVQDFIKKIKDAEIKNIFRLAFAATMVQYSNYSYEPSLGQRVSSGKSEIEDFEVDKVILSKLNNMLSDIRWYKEKLPNGKAASKVYNRSFFDNAKIIKSDSVDLIITSPPYLNNYHYNRNTRPQLYWLGFAQSPSELKRLEELNFGKYWQTVRDRKDIPLIFSLKGSDLEETLERLRKKNNQKGTYGGRGWANYAVSYFNDCYNFSLSIKRILKPNGTALVVLGNSILQGIFIPTDQYFGEIARSVGLKLINIDIPRKARIGNSIIQSNVRSAKAEDAHQLYEAIVEVRKTS